MNAREVAAYVPDAGGVGLEEMARTLEADVDDVALLARGLQQQRLVTLKGGSVYATEALKMDRRDGILPRYAPPPPCEADAPKTAADGRVFEYVSLIWGGRRRELMEMFDLDNRQVDDIIGPLCRCGMLRATKSGWLGLNGERFSVPDSAAVRQVREKYAPSASVEDGLMSYRTKIDVLAELVESFSPLPLAKAAACLGAPAEKLLYVAETLHENRVLAMKHMGVKSLLIRNGGIAQDSSVTVGGSCREVSRYQVAKDGVSLEAILADVGGERRYMLRHPRFRRPTVAVLDRIYEMASPGLEWGEMKSPKDFEAVKERLRTNLKATIDERLPFVDEDVRKVMLVELVNRMHLGRLEYLLRDPHVEEIKAQSGRNVYIKHVGCQQEWVETNVRVSADELGRYAGTIARETAQQVDSSHPLLDAILYTGDRVNVSLPETAGGAHVMEIRVFSKKPWNFVRLIRRGTVDAEVMAFLWLAIQYRLNILVSGETGSGKTSFLNALSLFLPKNDHIVSVEDTRELQLPEFFGNWSHLTVRRAGGESDVTMSRLLINALRMNPSFIIMGEVRYPQDIEALMRATAMGHPVMSTIHTRDCTTTVKRFQDAGISHNDMSNIHLNVILEAVRSKEEPLQSRRRVKEVGEYLLSPQGIAVNRIYRIDLGLDRILAQNEPAGYYQRIMDRVNMDAPEIRENIRQKAQIIRWLVGLGVEDIDVLGRVIQLYYRNPAAVVRAARENSVEEALLKNEA
jgi:archaeal flagellar protein FlaI